jgi:hypothetical protein
LLIAAAARLQCQVLFANHKAVVGTGIHVEREQYVVGIQIISVIHQAASTLREIQRIRCLLLRVVACVTVILNTIQFAAQLEKHIPIHARLYAQVKHYSVLEAALSNHPAYHISTIYFHEVCTRHAAIIVALYVDQIIVRTSMSAPRRKQGQVLSIIQHV